MSNDPPETPPTADAPPAPNPFMPKPATAYIERHDKTAGHPPVHVEGGVVWVCASDVNRELVGVPVSAVLHALLQPGVVAADQEPYLAEALVSTGLRIDANREARLLHLPADRNGESLTGEVLADLLSLVEVAADPARLAALSEEHRDAIEAWAADQHLLASDNIIDDPAEYPIEAMKLAGAVDEASLRPLCTWLSNEATIPATPYDVIRLSDAARSVFAALHDSAQGNGPVHPQAVIDLRHALDELRGITDTAGVKAWDVYVAESHLLANVEVSDG